MDQRELNNKTIRHYCQPGKLIYYIFNFQRGRDTHQNFLYPGSWYFLGIKIFGLTVSLVYNILVVFFGRGYSKYWYFYGVTFIKMHILTYLFAYLKPKFGTRNCMRSYLLGFIFSTGIILGAFENFGIFWGWDLFSVTSLGIESVGEYPPRI